MDIKTLINVALAADVPAVTKQRAAAETAVRTTRDALAAAESKERTLLETRTRLAERLVILGTALQDSVLTVAAGVRSSVSQDVPKLAGLMGARTQLATAREALALTLTHVDTVERPAAMTARLQAALSHNDASVDWVRAEGILRTREVLQKLAPSMEADAGVVPEFTSNSVPAQFVAKLGELEREAVKLRAELAHA